MSPWSRLPARGRILRLLGVLLLWAGASLAAQSPERQPAILLKGPFPVKSILLLAANTIPAYSGEYAFEGERVQVVFTRRKLPLSKLWAPLPPCGKLALYRVASEESLTVFFQEQDFSLFFAFAGEPAYACPFMARFVERFTLLLGFAQHEVDVPFPAILDLSLK